MPDSERTSHDHVDPFLCMLLNVVANTALLKSTLVCYQSPSAPFHVLGNSAPYDTTAARQRYKVDQLAALVHGCTALCC